MTPLKRFAAASPSAPATALATAIVTAFAGLVALPAPLNPTLAAAPACSARSGALAPTVVELYTSEGCNSCPPADRWLSRLKADPAIVALAFHVDYWDRLGWKDRFASPVYTQRQVQQQSVSGARFSYTPQVIVNGVDRPDWPRASVPAARPAPVDVKLSRDAGRVTAVVSAANGVPARLAAYWAVTEHGHVSAVKAGENEGVTLTHDAVVRAYQPVPPWRVQPEGRTLLFDLAGQSDAAHPRGLHLVVLDGDTGRPVQAVTLGC